MTTLHAEAHTTRLGDLVAAAFDRASRLSGNPAIVAALATRRIEALLAAAGRPQVARALASTARELSSGGTSSREASVRRLHPRRRGAGRQAAPQAA